MAKKAKGNRIQVILECTEHKESGMPGTSRYITTKNRKNTTARIELKKLIVLTTSWSNSISFHLNSDICVIKSEFLAHGVNRFVLRFVIGSDEHFG